MLPPKRLCASMRTLDPARGVTFPRTHTSAVRARCAVGAGQWFFSDEARAEREERRKQLEREGLLEYTTLSPGAPVTLHGLIGLCVCAGLQSRTHATYLNPKPLSLNPKPYTH